MAGTFSFQTPFVITFTQGAAGAATNDFTMTRGGVLVDVVVITRATQAGGTCQILKSADPITAALVATPEDTLTRPATLDQTFSTFAVGGVLRVTTAGGAAALVTAIMTFLPPNVNPTAAV